ncbi:MAG: hypothetical protein E6G66_17920, partial [Actinobacteria bacterium]
MSGLLPDGRIALASILAGVTAAAAAGLIVRPTPRLASRVRPYTLIPRSRLGRSADIPDLAGEEAWLSGGTFRRLFGPPVLALAGWLGGLLDARSDQGLRLMLRQAGYRDLSPEEYRVRQLGAAALGAAAGVTAGLLVVGSLAAGAVTFALVAAITGSPVVAIVPAAALGLLPRAYFGHRRARRLSELQQAWPDGIRHIIGGIQSGMSLNQSIAALATNGPEPLRLAFSRFAV